MIRRVPIVSDNLETVGYDPVDEVLVVTFVAAPRLLYTYRNVTPQMFMDLLVAESHGRWFHRNIRTQPERFPYTKRRIEDDATEVQSLQPKDDLEGLREVRSPVERASHRQPSRGIVSLLLWGLRRLGGGPHRA